MFFRSDLEAVLGEDFDCAVASTRFVGAELRCRHIVSETDFEVFPIHATQYGNRVLKTVIEAEPHGVLVFEHAGDVDLEGREVGGLHEHRWEQMVRLVVKDVVVTTEEVDGACVLVIERGALCSEYIFCRQAEEQTSGLGVVQTGGNVENHFALRLVRCQKGVSMLLIDGILIVPGKIFEPDEVCVIQCTVCEVRLKAYRETAFRCEEPVCVVDVEVEGIVVAQFVGKNGQADTAVEEVHRHIEGE